MLDETRLGLFEGVGVELEYMIVDQQRLAPLPVSDRVLAAQAGCIVSDVEFDDISWSNELVLHVIELKTSGPAGRLDNLPALFHNHVQRVNNHLAPLGGRLMPTGMHPWMDPHTDTQLWPHDYSPVYEGFNRIFNCRGHGWANLQSVHINLPFAGDEQFARLHAAIRLLLPILPALAASSPIIDGQVTGILDNRLEAYRTNSLAIPSVAGSIIPEPVFSAEAYQTRILRRIYDDLAPYDPAGVLQYEWANARGAIARFDRDTIEIRLIDVQECPLADVAVTAAVVGVLKLLVAETWSDLSSQKSWPVEPLAAILRATTLEGEHTTIADAAYLAAVGWSGPVPCTAEQVWRHLVEAIGTRLPAEIAFCRRELGVILDHGPLARRILHTLGRQFSRPQLAAVYRQLSDCLATNQMFTG